MSRARPFVDPGHSGVDLMSYVRLLDGGLVAVRSPLDRNGEDEAYP